MIYGELNVQDFDNIVALKWIKYGQPRRYADSVYEAELIFTGKNISCNKNKDKNSILVCGCNPNEEHVKKVCKLLVHSFKEKDIGMGDATLDRLECLEKGNGFSKWAVKITSPYMD